mmetsp:Transcript_9574/g.15139  ORF Transcript_9574/g.15139 Transcript_9574/m.15139 type:complete len:94 (+) Transcript_9574:170-451(+)
MMHSNALPIIATGSWAVDCTDSFVCAMTLVCVATGSWAVDRKDSFVSTMTQLWVRQWAVGQLTAKGCCCAANLGRHNSFLCDVICVGDGQLVS